MNVNQLAGSLEIESSQMEYGYVVSDWELLQDAAAMLRKLQYQNDKYKQVLESIANERVELSHDKIKWQCEDHIKWAKDVLK